MVGVSAISDVTDSVAGLLLRSFECSTKPRSVSTGPPNSTGTRGVDSVTGMSSLRHQVAERQPVERLVDDQAQGAIRGVRAHEDDALFETRIGHAGHGDQELSGQKAVAVPPLRQVMRCHRDNLRLFRPFATGRTMR